MTITTIILFVINTILINIVNINNYFYPLLLLVLISIYPIIMPNEDKYLRYILILGILADILYSDIILFNVISFLLISFILIKINYYISNKYIIYLLSISISIILYEILSYISYVVFINYSFSFNILFNSIFRSLLLNIIIGILVLYFSLKNIHNKDTNLHIISR